MDPAAVSVTFDLPFALTALAFVLGGALLGTISGLTPGLHANNFALLLAAALALAMVMLAGAEARAAETRLRQGAGAEIGLTDNVDLVPDDEKTSAGLLTLSHDAHLSVDRNRLDFDFTSDIALETESNEGDTFVDQQVRALGNVEVVPEWFFVDLAGSSTRQNTSNRGRLSAGGRSRGQDKATVNVVEVSPYISRRIGSYARGELRARHTETFVSEEESAGGNLSDRRIDEQQLVVVSGPRISPVRLRGELSHLDSRAVRDDTEEDNDLEIYQGAFTTAYGLTRNFAVLATVGATDVDTADDRDLSGPLWDVGVEISGARLQAAATVGRRYGENRATLDAQYQPTAKTRVEAELTRALETSQGAIATLNRERVADPTTAAIFSNGFSEDVEEGVALAWRGRLRATSQLRRDTLRLGFRFSDREFVDRTDQTVEGRFRWERDLARRWRSRLTVLGRRTTGSARSDTSLVGARAELAHAVSRRAEVFAGLSRTDQFSDDPNEEYTENMVFIGARVGF
jgi:uncharacterized protein (PEP-CTERM system associated)